jgi:hypothetical protein
MHEKNIKAYIQKEISKKLNCYLVKSLRWSPIMCPTTSSLLCKIVVDHGSEYLLRHLMLSMTCMSKTSDNRLEIEIISSIVQVQRRFMQFCVMRYGCDDVGNVIWSEVTWCICLNWINGIQFVWEFSDWCLLTCWYRVDVILLIIW